MSRAKTKNDAAEEGSAEAAEDSEVVTLERPIRRRRWKLWIALALIAAAFWLVPRFFVAPIVAERLSRVLGTRVVIGGVGIEPIDAVVVLHDVTVDAPPGQPRPPDGAPAIEAERVRVDIQWLPLLHRTLLVRELAFESARVALDRLPDGSFNLETFGGSTPGGELPSGWSFALDRIALRDSKIQLRDLAGGGTESFVVGLRDAEFSTRKRRASAFGRVPNLQVDAVVKGGRIRVDGSYDVRDEGPVLDALIRAKDVPLAQLRPYLPDSGWTNLTGRVSGQLRYQREPHRREMLTGRLMLRRVAIQVPGIDEAAIAVRKALVDIERIDLLRRRIAIGSLTLHGPTVAAHPASTAIVGWLEQARGVGAPRGRPASASSAEATPSWSWMIERFATSLGRLRVPTPQGAVDIRASVNAENLGPAAYWSPLRAHLQGAAGEASFDGTTRLTRGLVIEGRLTADGIDVPTLAQGLGLPWADLARAGTAKADLTVELEPGARRGRAFDVRGGVALRDVWFAGPDPSVLAFGALGIDLTLAGMVLAGEEGRRDGASELRISDATVGSPFVLLTRTADGWALPPFEAIPIAGEEGAAGEASSPREGTGSGSSDEPTSREAGGTEASTERSRVASAGETASPVSVASETSTREAAGEAAGDGGSIAAARAPDETAVRPPTAAARARAAFAEARARATAIDQAVREAAVFARARAVPAPDAAAGAPGEPGAPAPDASNPDGSGAPAGTAEVRPLATKRVSDVRIEAATGLPGSARSKALAAPSAGSPVPADDAAADAPSGSTAPAAEQAPPLNLVIASLRTHDGTLAVIDEVATPTLVWNVEGVEGGARDLRLPGLGFTELVVRGREPRYGLLQLAGYRSAASASLQLWAESFPLSAATPYLERARLPYRFVGGSGSFLSRISIGLRGWDAETDLTLRHPIFASGEYELQRALGMPLPEAISLLRGAQGEFTVHLALSSPRDGAWGSFETSVANALRDELWLAREAAPVEVMFALGRADLRPEAMQRLASIGRILSSRPGLIVELDAALSSHDRRWIEEQELALELGDRGGVMGVLRVFGVRDAHERIRDALAQRAVGQRGWLDRSDEEELTDMLAERPRIPPDRVLSLAEARLMRVADHLAEQHGVERSRVRFGPRPVRETTAPPAVRARVARAPAAAMTFAPGGMPGAMPGGMPGAIPGGVPGGMPGGIPGAPPGGMPGAIPGGVPGAPPSGAPGAPPSGALGAPPSGVPGAPPSGVPAGPPSGPPGAPSPFGRTSAPPPGAAGIAPPQPGAALPRDAAPPPLGRIPPPRQSMTLPNGAAVAPRSTAPFPPARPPAQPPAQPLRPYDGASDATGASSPADPSNRPRAAGPLPHGRAGRASHGAARPADAPPPY